MKKFLFLLSAIILGVAVSTAQETFPVYIGETGYADIYEAVKAATEGDVIMINEDITIKESVSLTDVDNLTIKAADGVTVNCLVKNKLAFLVKKTATLENLNMVYVEADASNQGLIECSTGAGKLTIKNCTVSDFNTTNNQGVVSVKSSGHAYFNGFAVKTTTVPKGRGEVFIGQSGSTLSGNSTASLFIEKNLNITANADFAPDQVVDIYVDANRSLGSTVVVGTKDVAKFHLVSDKFKLKASNGNLVTADINDVAPVTIGAKEYDSLSEAVTAATDGDVININKNIEITNRVDFTSGNITLKGTNNAVLSCRTHAKFAILVKGHAKLSIENLTLEYNDSQTDRPLLRIEESGNLTVKNCTISKFNTSCGNSNGIVGFKDTATGSVYLENVLFSECKVPDNMAEIYLVKSGSTIAGTTNGSIMLQENVTFNVVDFAPAAREEAAAAALIADDEAEAAVNPVKLYLETAPSATEATDIVFGTHNAALFDLQSDTHYLVGDADANKLFAWPNNLSGVEEVEAEEDVNAPAVYYNLNGVAVDAANLVPGLYIRVQGGKAAKVAINN